MKQFLYFILIFGSAIVNGQKIIPLYSGDAPGFNGNPSNLVEKDVSEKKDGIIRLRNVISPSLEYYAPKTNNNNGTAVIICPGGGYHILAYDHEGTEIAQWFADRGINAFVLKYRLPQSELFINPTIRPLEDAQNAIYYVRKNAKSYGIDSSKIGIMGFSAGGHLASSLSTKFESAVGYIPSKDISLRPDFSILMYPVISFDEEIGHSGSKENLISKNASQELIDSYSNNLNVTKNVPPTFMVHANDDFVSVLNSIVYAKAIKENNGSVELHIFDRGGHGFALKKNNDLPIEKWPNLLENWLIINNLY